MSPPAALTPAQLTFDADGTPCAPDYGDVYHTAAGAFAQAQHVFLAGNGLPGRWQGRERFVILETGFGLGNNFLATWAAWRADTARCERLVFISLEKHPLTAPDLHRVHQASAEPALAAQLIAQWPLATPDTHSLDFDDGRVQLLLVFGDVAQTLPGVQAEVDAFFLDGFAPARNAAMWSDDVFRRVGRLAAPGATAATWSAARAVRDGLASSGFVVERAPGFGGKRDITVARFAPRFVPPRPAAWRPAHAGPREALVIGAGLAGCATAWALARQGWHATVLDRQPAPARETSGNPGGLMHGIFNAPDSVHARWFRHAALLTARLARPALADGAVAGRLDGFVRLEPRLDTAAARAQLDRVGLPADYVDWLDRDAAAERCGLAVPSGGWFYRDAGWLSPGDWSRWLLAEASRQGRATFRGGVTVDRLVPGGAGWLAVDAAGQVVGDAPVLVLASAMEAQRLLPAGSPPLPLQPVRGQTTVLPAASAGLRRPARALSGQGYALTLPDGCVLTGATTRHDDADPAVRDSDHHHNLERAVRLGVLPVLPPVSADADLGTLCGRTGWRATTPDRLPLVGPPVDLAALAGARDARRRLDALRLLPRRHDDRHALVLLTGLGARGITSAALAAQVATAWITGAPSPVDAALRDAIDIARG